MPRRGVDRRRQRRMGPGLPPTDGGGVHGDDSQHTAAQVLAVQREQRSGQGCVEGKRPEKDSSGDRRSVVGLIDLIRSQDLRVVLHLKRICMCAIRKKREFVHVRLNVKSNSNHRDCVIGVNRHARVQLFRYFVFLWLPEVCFDC